MRRRIRRCPARGRLSSTLQGTAGVIALVVSVVGCGKKGPPLPPFVRIPAVPAEMAAARRGETIQVTFLVPGANADGSRPANVERVEVYAITAPPSIGADDIRRLGDRLGTIRVNPPPDPDGNTRPPVEGGVDQGAPVTLTETLTAENREPVELPAAAAGPPTVRPGAPLLPPPDVGPPTRIYMALPVGGGRIGSAARALVPLVPSPSPPGALRVAYDEDAVRVTWGTASGRSTGSGTSGGLLIARPLSDLAGPLTYHVYEISAPEAEAPTERRLTTRPADMPPFVDPRVAFGEERCYTVRAVQRVGALSIESEAPPAACVDMVDTFPPRPPTGLTTVPSDGAISLIWDPGDAADLAGYHVLRGEPGGTLTRITPTVLQETSFRDVLASGTRVAYAVQAVDREGNVSAPSSSVEDTAR